MYLSDESSSTRPVTLYRQIHPSRIVEHRRPNGLPIPTRPGAIGPHLARNLSLEEIKHQRTFTQDLTVTGLTKRLEELGKRDHRVNIPHLAISADTRTLKNPYTISKGTTSIISPIRAITMIPQVITSTEMARLKMVGEPGRILKSNAPMLCDSS